MKTYGEEKIFRTGKIIEVVNASPLLYPRTFHPPLIHPSILPSILHPSIHPLWRTGSSQVLDLSRNLDVGFRGQSQAASLSYAVTQQGNVSLESIGITGEAQYLCSCMSQWCRLVFGTSRKASPQEMGDGSVAALLPALRKGDEETWNYELWLMKMMNLSWKMGLKYKGKGRLSLIWIGGECCRYVW